MSPTATRHAGWAAALAAAAFLAAPAMAQTRLSLSERVARLEQQMQGQGSGQSTVELLNRLDALQAEVQDLRGQLEQQAYEIENLKKQQRDRYRGVSHIPPSANRMLISLWPPLQRSEERRVGKE